MGKKEQASRRLLSEHDLNLISSLEGDEHHFGSLESSFGISLSREQRSSLVEAMFDLAEKLADHGSRLSYVARCRSAEARLASKLTAFLAELDRQGELPITSPDRAGYETFVDLLSNPSDPEDTLEEVKEFRNDMGLLQGLLRRPRCRDSKSLLRYQLYESFGEVYEAGGGIVGASYKPGKGVDSPFIRFIRAAIAPCPEPFRNYVYSGLPEDVRAWHRMVLRGQGC